MRPRRRVPGHAYSKDKLTLGHDVDTAARNINLSPVRDVDILEKDRLLARARHEC
jgi:hypothetical protein